MNLYRIERVSDGRNDYSFFQAIQHVIFTVPGDPADDLDLGPIVQISKDANYDRWLVIEAEQNPQRPTHINGPR